MLKKVPLVLSILAALGFAVAISAPADAVQVNSGLSADSHLILVKQGDKSGSKTSSGSSFKKSGGSSFTKKSGGSSFTKKSSGSSFTKKSSGSKFTKKSSTGSKFIAGHKYGSHTYFGHHRHRWHGRWYDYGVGECWILIDGEWFWNELVCPF